MGWTHEHPDLYGHQQRAGYVLSLLQATPL